VNLENLNGKIYGIPVDKNLKKLQQGKRSGESGGSKMSSTWPYSQNLLFLSHQMTPRTFCGNISGSSGINTIDDDSSVSTDIQQIDSKENVSTEQSCEIGELAEPGSQSIHAPDDHNKKFQLIKNQPRNVGKILRKNY
jgi:hypothetical protein